ncbi:hypothetical protein CYLTODRAFT_408930 [Cylindrobasidium torrendii FP15055 ss-10]|uniref:Chromo domain-containing protein n=1 Tax=Cylindrobasidium torrendii FP15055 ss-10 TaxID=1314674 RepID=A0A0D7BLH8_9AGAR|nr:hypothetical protein CYLTODRAFT_408930 [Cylindrobasidium torrendii FP15055 ss-10]
MAVSARKGKASKVANASPARQSKRQKATAARKRTTTKATAGKAKAKASTAKKAKASQPAAAPPLPVGKGANKEYYVERIVKERPAGRGKQYLVRWEGYPPSDDSWLSAASLADCVALDEWQGLNKKPTKSRKRR